MGSKKEFAKFKGGPSHLDGSKYPFMGRAKPVTSLRVTVVLPDRTITHLYKRYTRRGNTHYYSFQYTHTRYIIR